MAARKPWPTLLLAPALIFAAALSGCSSSSPDEPPVAPVQIKPATVPEAETALRDAETTRDNLKRAAQDAKDDVERAKREADRLEEIARRNGIDVTVPNTRAAQARAVQQKAERAAEQADEQVKDAEVKVRQARDNLSAIRHTLNAPHAPQAQPQPIDTPLVREAGFLSGVGAWLLPGTVLLLGLGFITALSWLTWKKFASIGEETEQIHKLVKRQDEKLLYLRKSLLSINDLSNKQLTALQKDISHLTRAIEIVFNAQAIQSRPAVVSYSAEPYVSARYVPLDDDSPVFPVTVETLLTQFDGRQQIVKPDLLRNLLVKDSDGRGQLVLVQDGGGSGGQLYIIPRITRFQTMQDFYNYYEQFYDCARPGAGEVWINQPAVVNGVDGGWTLIEKGELEVKT